MEKRKPRPRRSFTPEFKAENVELCQHGETSGQLPQRPRANSGKVLNCRLDTSALRCRVRATFDSEGRHGRPE